MLALKPRSCSAVRPIARKADLPKRLFPAFRAGIELVRETDYDGGTNDRSRFIERMLERIERWETEKGEKYTWLSVTEGESCVRATPLYQR